MTSSWLGLPCPDCGGENRSRVEVRDGVQWLIVFCPACDSLLEAIPTDEEGERGVEAKGVGDG